MQIHKSLPDLPPNAHATSSEPASQSPFSPDNESPPSEGFSDTPTELPRISQKRPSPSRSSSQNGMSSEQTWAPPKRPPNSRSSSSQSRHRHRDRSPAAPLEDRKENLTLPSTKYDNRHSGLSQRSDASGNGEDFFIPMALDPNPAPGPSPMVGSSQFDGPAEENENVAPQGPPPRSASRDYFNAKGSVARARKASQEQRNHSNNHPPSNPVYASPHPESPRDLSQPSSPHIAYQEIGREMSPENIEHSRKRKDPVGRNTSIASVTHDQPRGESPNGSRSRPPNGESRNGKFILQEVPKSKKIGGSARSSQSDPSLLLDVPAGLRTSKSAPPSANPEVTEQEVPVPSSDSPRSLQPQPPVSSPPHPTFDSKSVENAMTESSNSSPTSTQLQNVPQRGDSLAKSKSLSTRKESSNTGAASRLLTSLINAESEDKPLSAPPAIGTHYTNTPSGNGVRSTTRIDSSESGSLTDIQHPPLRSRERVPLVGSASNVPSTPSRQISHQPNGIYHKSRNESISTLKSESTHTGDQPTSPKKLPRYSAGQEFSLDDDMIRIMGPEEHQNHESFLRRVSNSVRHARSYSDRGGSRLSKEHRWHRSQLTSPSGYGQDISSPTVSSPEEKEEVTFLKNELHKERQRSLEKEQRLMELEAALEAKNNIKQMNSELREKRSTIVVLDTQKEIVVRELEVLTEHIAESKKSREPLDLGKMSNAVLREFAESLQKLKDSFTPQIEDLAHRRHELLEEVKNIELLRDRSLLDFEKISEKNAQLTEMNNQILQQIQELYKANATAQPMEVLRNGTHGLGIYHHHKDASTASFDGRELRPSITESSATGSTLVHENDSEIQPATYVTAPQVVNIRKGQPKKFNWKKGGHNVAKGVTKGLKGAFSSNDERKHQRDGQYTEGVPYSQTVQNAAYPSTDSSLKYQYHDPSRQGVGFFDRQKGKAQRSTPNGSMPAVNNSASVGLFGLELEHRAEFEGGGIPGIVMRCIQEVEMRGMDLEGIYRKSGGNSQIQGIKEGFERSNDYDISDPDLDINAVTSTLKQYFRKLPTPLITYDVYDKLLSSAPPLPPAHPAGALQANPNHKLDPEQREQRVAMMREAVNDLPPVHRTCLEVLVFHLARVVEREKENLMTSLNVAVVFAPTIMRPESLAREMSESQAKNQAVQFLIENCEGVFLRKSESV
ncbi:MAG: hypothetical protein Q9190_006342 [Brigantiaea leucoxantha]